MAVLFSDINVDSHHHSFAHSTVLAHFYSYETLKAAYQIIPADSRSALIKEVETLCQNAGIVPGQEPLDCGFDSVIDSTAPSNISEAFGRKNNKQYEPLDDRAIRDSFLRFFCSILGGYERFLVVPDADFLISGNDWFDSSKFIAASVPSSTPFLNTLVGTQLFQSFIQRRTEASDVHCMLFDECLVEYHSSKVPYGVFGDGDLLVDQCATEPDDPLLDEVSSFMASSEVDDKQFPNDNDAATQASSGYAETTISATSVDAEASTFAINASGDIVTMPSVSGLPLNARFMYCVNGQPSFPTSFDLDCFFPKEPEVLATDSSEVPPPILTRSERERDEANRMCNMTISRRVPQKQHRCLWQLPKYMGSQFFGAWLMCIPNQLCQSNISVNEKSKILLRALGALRTLRSHRRIVADEAAYRALIVACGKCGTDRRIELMKLYGLMRTDGIFPNAVTLGQYTRAIAEGFSRRSEESHAKSGMQIVVPTNGKKPSQKVNLEVLDSNLQSLEESGLRWRSRGNSSQTQDAPLSGVIYSDVVKDQTEVKHTNISPTKTFDTATTHRPSKAKRSWIPVSCSSSFCNSSYVEATSESSKMRVRLYALWSRTTTCESCSYIPLDEEIQCGWDVIHSNADNDPSIACPRCGSPITPQLGYEEVLIKETYETKNHELSFVVSSTHDETNQSIEVSRLENEPNVTRDTPLQGIPPQLESNIHDGNSSTDRNDEGRTGFVTYISPHRLRLLLEQLVFEFGEEVLDRDRLRLLNPQVFFNLWWYSSRFSLPLPLACSASDGIDNESLCAFASWDKGVAIQGCLSAAKAIAAAQALPFSKERLLREKLFDNPNTDMPLLAFFNLQNYAQQDWDHEDLSEVLVTLVKACDTRDLLPVVECVFRRNDLRKEEQERSGRNNSMDLSFESAGTSTFSLGASMDLSLRPSAELDCYRTILYLARYQCQAAFHAFFPTTTRACKGYHFWCAQGTPLPIFDRAFREAADEYSKKNNTIVPVPDASDVALGFRCVFGHLI
eukprot:scaffold13318_cov193-Alexandrium_tamarense.AAC.6